MSILHICLIAGGALLFLIIVLVCVKVSNKKKASILDQNLKKYQQENQDFEKVNRVVISEDKKIEEEVKQDPEEISPPENADEVSQQPQVEEFKFEEDEEWKKEESPFEMPNDLNERPTFKYQPQPNKQNSFKPKEIKLDARQIREKDFEKFMNEHSYSRKILDKKMIDKIKRLPPELKAMLLTSVFDKFDDNK